MAVNDQNILISNIVKQIDDVAQAAIKKAEEDVAKLQKQAQAQKSSSSTSNVDINASLAKLNDTKTYIQGVADRLKKQVTTSRPSDKQLSKISEQVQDLAKTYNVTFSQIDEAKKKIYQSNVQKQQQAAKVNAEINQTLTSMQTRYKTYQDPQKSMDTAQLQAVARFNKGKKRSVTALKGTGNEYVAPYAGSKKDQSIIDFDPNELAFFDTETIGKQGETNFGVTQLSVRVGDKTKTAFIKLNQQQKDYINKTLAKVKAGESVNKDEQRDLLSFANLVEETANNQTKITSGEFFVPKNYKLTSKSTDVLDRIQKGIELLTGGSKATNLYGTANAAYKATMPKNRTAAGQNIDFDVPALKLSGVKGVAKIENSIDTLDLAKQFVNIGAIRQNKETGQVKELKGYSLDALADFFEVQIDESKRHTAEFDTWLNKEIAVALKDYIINNPDKLSPATTVQVQPGQFGTAGRTYVRKAHDTKSFKTNSEGMVIDPETFGKALLKAGESYKFEGISGTGGDRMAKFVGTSNGEEVYISAADMSEFQAMMAGVFDGVFEDGLDAKAEADAIVANLVRTGGFGEARRITNPSLYTSGFDNSRRAAIGYNASDPSKSSDTYKLLDTIVTAISQSGMDYEQQALAFNQTMKQLGAKRGIQLNAANLNKMIADGSQKTFVSLRKSYLDFIDEYENALGGKETANNLKQAVLDPSLVVNDSEISQGGNPFYNVGRLILAHLNEQAIMVKAKFPDNKSISTPNGINPQDYVAEIVENAVSNVKSSTITKDNVVAKLSAGQNQHFKDALSGQSIVNQLKNFGYSEGEAKNLKGTSLGSTLADIVDVAGEQGIDVAVQVDDNGNIKIGLYDKFKREGLFDENGNPLWDKMASTTFSIADEDGVLNVNGQRKSNMMLAGDYGGPEGLSLGFITVQEEQANRLLRTLNARKAGESQSDLAKLITGTEDAKADIVAATKKLSGIQATVYKDVASASTYKVNANEVESDLNAGGTEEQKRIRASATNMVGFYKAVWQKYKGRTEMTQKDLEAMHILFTTLQSNSEDIVQFQDGGRLQELSEIEGLTEELKAQAVKMRVDYSGLKEEAFDSFILNQTGSSSIEPFNAVSAQDNRAPSQMYNYMERTKKALEKMKDVTSPALITPSDEKLAGSNNRQTYTIGKTTDKRIADVYASLGLQGLMPSVREGTIIIPQSIADTLESMRVESHEFKDKDMSKDFLKAYGLTEMKEGDFIELGEEVALPMKMGFAHGRDYNTEMGDVIAGIEKTADGYIVQLKKTIEASTGVKALSQFGVGNRTIIQTISDELFQKIVKALGLDGAQALVEDSKIKPKQLGGTVASRYEWIFNEFIKSKVTSADPAEQEKQRQEAIKQISDTIVKLTKDNVINLGNVLEYNEGTGTFTKKAGLSDEEAKKALQDAGILNVFSKNSDAYKLSEVLMGPEWAEKSLTTPLMTAAINLAQEYFFFEGVGNENAAELEDKHRVKMGDREKKASLRVAGLLRATGVDEEVVQAYEKNLGELFSNISPKRQKKRDEAQKVVKAIKDTLGRNIGNPSDYLTVYSGDSGGEEGAVIVEQLVNRLTEWEDSGGVSEEDYALSPMGYLAEKLKEAGLDKAVLHLENPVSLGKVNGHLREIQDIVLPILDAEKVGDSTVVNELNKQLSVLMRVLANKESPTYEADVEEAVKNWLAVTENAVGNKEGVFYDTLHETAIPHAAASKSVGMNIEQSLANPELFSNTVLMTPEKVRDILTAGDIDIEAQGSQLDKLEASLKELGQEIPADYNEAREKWENDKDNIENFRVAESSLIDKIIETITLREDLSAEQQQFLYSFYHRYPSINGLDEIVTRIAVVGKDNSFGIQMGDNGVLVDAGLAELTKTDFDGDVIRNALGLTTGEFDEKTFKGNQQALKEAQKIVSRVTQRLTRLTAADMEDETWAEELADDDIANLASQNHPLAAIFSKNNKKYTGSLSNYSTAVREALYNAGLDERAIKGKDDITGKQNAAMSILTRAIFETIEQDAISSKKIGQRVYAKAKDKLIDQGKSESEITESDLEKILTEEIGEMQDKLYNGKIWEALQKAKTIGIFDDDEMIKTSRMRSALAMVQETLGGDYLKMFGFTPDQIAGDISGMSFDQVQNVIKAAESRFARPNGGTSLWYDIFKVINRSGAAKVTPEKANYGALVNDANKHIETDLSKFKPGLATSKAPINLALASPEQQTQAQKSSATLGQTMEAENQAVLGADSAWGEHSDLVQAAIAAENAKIAVSKKLVGQLGAEGDALEGVEAQAQQTDQAVQKSFDNFTQFSKTVKLESARAIVAKQGEKWDKNEQKWVKNTDNPYGLVTVDAEGNTIPLTSISSMLHTLTGGASPQWEADEKEIKDMAAKLAKDVFDTPEERQAKIKENLTAGDINGRWKGGRIDTVMNSMLSNEAGTVSHKALEVIGQYQALNKDWDARNWQEALDSKNWEAMIASGQITDKSRGYQAFKEYGALKAEKVDLLARFGLDESFLNLKTNLDAITDLFAKNGIKLTDVTEQVFGIEFKGNYGTERVGLVIDQLAKDINDAFVNIDYKFAKKLSPGYAVQLAMGQLGVNLAGENAGALLPPEILALTENFKGGKIIGGDAKNYLIQTKDGISVQVPVDQITSEILYGLKAWASRIERGEGTPLTREEQERFMGIPHSPLPIRGEAQREQSADAVGGDPDGARSLPFGDKDVFSKNAQTALNTVRGFGDQLRQVVEEETFDPTFETMQARVATYKKGVDTQVKALSDMAKAQNNIAVYEAQIDQLKNSENVDSKEITNLEKKLALEEERLRVAQEQYNIGQQIAAKTNVVEMMNESDPEKILDQKTANQVRDINTKATIAAAQNVGSIDAKQIADQNIAQYNNANTLITEYINNLKQQQAIEAQILKVRKDMEQATGVRRQDLGTYLQSLESQKRALGEQAPTMGQTTNADGETVATLGGVQLSTAQTEALRSSIASVNAEFENTKLNIQANYKTSMSLLDQLVAGFKRVFENVTVYSLASRMFSSITRGIQQVIQSTKDLDAALVDIQIASGFSRNEVSDMMNEYNALGKELGKTTQEIAQASNDWLRAGYTGEEAMELTRASAQLATLGMIDTASATSYLISSMKGWKLAAEDVSSVVDKLTAVDMSAAISAGDLAEAMSRGNNSAQMAGVSMDTYIGMLTTVADITQRSAESVGEAFKTIFSRMGNVKLGKYTASLEEQESPDFDESEWENLSDVEIALDNIGISLRTNYNTYKDTEDIMEEIGEKWNTLDQVAKNSLVTALFGTRQREIGITLFENWDDVGNYADIAANSYGTAVEKMEAYTDSVEAAQKRIQVAIEKWALNLGGSEALKTFYNIIADVTENIHVFGTAIMALVAILKADEVANAVSKTGGNFAGALANLTLVGRNIEAKGGIRGTLSSAWANAGNNMSANYQSNLQRVYETSLATSLQGMDATQIQNFKNLQSIMFMGDETQRTAVANFFANLEATTASLGNTNVGLLAGIESQQARNAILNWVSTAYSDEYNALVKGIQSDDAETIATKKLEIAEELLAKKLTERANQQGVSAVQTGAQNYLQRGDNLNRAATNAALQGAATIGGGILGMYSGSALGEELFGDTGSAIGGVLGSAIVSGATSSLITGLPAAISAFAGGAGFLSSFIPVIGPFIAVAGAAITAGWAFWKKKQQEELEELAQDATNQIEKLSSMQDSLTIASKYDELAKGVDRFGRNVSLSEEDYATFLDYSTQLADTFPDLVKRVDSAGQAFVGYGDKIGNVTEKIKENIEAQTHASNRSILNDKLLADDYTKSKEDYEENKTGYETATKLRQEALDRVNLIDTKDALGSEFKAISWYSNNDRRQLIAMLEENGLKDGQDFNSTYPDGIRLYSEEAEKIGATIAKDYYTSLANDYQDEQTEFFTEQEKLRNEFSDKLNAIYAETEYGYYDTTANPYSEVLGGLSEDAKEIIRDAVLDTFDFSSDAENMEDDVVATIGNLAQLFADNPLILTYAYQADEAQNQEEFVNARAKFKEELITAFSSDGIIDATEEAILVGWGFKFNGEVDGDKGEASLWGDTYDKYDDIVSAMGKPWSVSKEDLYSTFDSNEINTIFELANSGVLKTKMSIEDIKKLLTAMSQDTDMGTVFNQYSQQLDLMEKVTEDGGESIKDVFADIAKVSGKDKRLAKVISAENLAEEFPEMSEATRNFVEDLEKQFAEGTISAEEAYRQMFERMEDDAENAKDSFYGVINNTLFPDAEISGQIDTWKELYEALSQVASGYELLGEAESKQREYGTIGMKTALEMISADSRYLEALDFTTDGIKLKGNAQAIAAQIQLDAIKAQMQGIIAETEEANAQDENTLSKILLGETAVELADAEADAADARIAASTLVAEAYYREAKLGEARNKIAAGEDIDLEAYEADANSKQYEAATVQRTAVSGDALKALQAQLEERVGKAVLNDDYYATTDKYGNTVYVSYTRGKVDAKEALKQENGKVVFEGGTNQAKIDKAQEVVDWTEAQFEKIAAGNYATDLWEGFWDPSTDLNGNKGSDDFEEELATMLDKLKNYRELIDKEWEAMLSFDETTKIDSGTKYFEKMAANLKDIIAATKDEMAQFIATYQSAGTDLEGERITQKEYLEQVNTYEADLIDYQKELNNLDDEEIEDRQSLLETQNAHLETQIKIQKEYIETADTLEEYIERTQELLELEMERYEIAKGIAQYYEAQYEHELKYFDNLAISDPQYEVAMRLYQEQIDKQIETVLEQRNATWENAYKRLMEVDGYSSAEAYNLASVDEEVMDLTEEYWDLIEARGEAIVKRVEDRIAELDNQLDLYERSKPEDWSRYTQIAKYGEGQLNILEAKAAEIRKALEDVSLLTDEEIQDLVSSLNDVLESIKTAKEEMLQEQIDYQDSQFDALVNRIETFKQDLEDEKEAINDYYDDLIGNLQDEIDARDENAQLIELENNLLNARKEKSRVYREGIGWVYESSHDKIKEAQEDLKDYYDDQYLDDLEDTRDAEIELLDERIEAWDLYLEALQWQHDRVTRENEEFLLEEMMGLSSQEEVNAAIIADWENFNIYCNDSFEVYDGIFNNFLDNYESNLLRLQDLQKEVAELVDASQYLFDNNNLPNLTNEALAGSKNNGGDLADAYGMSETDKRALQAAGEMYTYAQKIADAAMMEQAHAWAESIRARYGYSGGADGSGNYYIDDTYLPDISRENDSWLEWQAEYVKMTEEDKQQILALKQQVAEASANGDTVLSAMLHNAAENIREKYGYSGGRYGDEFILLNDNNSLMKNYAKTASIEDNRLNDLKNYVNNSATMYKSALSQLTGYVSGENFNLSGHEDNYWYQKGVNEDMIEDWWSLDLEASDLWFSYLGSFDEFLNEYADRIEEYAELAQEVESINSGSSSSSSKNNYSSSTGTVSSSGSTSTKRPTSSSSTAEIYSYVGMTKADQNTIKALGDIATSAAKSGDRSKVTYAHEAAEQIRAKYGYSGGSDGSEFIVLKPGDKYYDLIEKPLPSYAFGIENGAVTYTGLAMLHGSQSAPEYVLNTPQVENLLYNLSTARLKDFETIGNSGSTVIYQVTGDIIVDGTSDPKEFWNEVTKSMNSRSNVTKNR